MRWIKLNQKRITILFCCLLLMITYPVNVYAFSKEQKDIFDKGVYFYDITPEKCTNSDATYDPNNVQNPNIYLVGDSYLSGLKDTAKIDNKLEAQGYKSSSNAHIGRSINGGGNEPDKQSGLQALDADSQKVKDAGTIVILLGTNNDTYSASIPVFMKKLKELNSQARVFWVNAGNSSPDSDVENNNKAIENNSKEHNYTVVDWYSKYKKNTSLISSDKLHPTANGYSELNDLIISSVGAVPKDTASSSVNGNIHGVYNSGLKGPYILEQFMIHVLKRMAQINKRSESDYLTQDHVVALIAFAFGEGGDINNSSVFNPMNGGMDPVAMLGKDYDGSVWGGDGTDGRRSYPTFDVGVELYARQFSKGNQSRLNKVLSQKNSTTKDFMYALTYFNEFPGNRIWAAASLPPNDKSYFQGRMNLVRQVENNYVAYASLGIGTPKLEQREGIRHKELVSFKNVKPGQNGSYAGISGVSGVEEIDGHRLPAYFGTTGREEAINEEGRVKSKWGSTGNDGRVTFADLLKKVPKQDQQKYMDYYITMRWNYAAWYWSGDNPKLVDSEEYGWFAKKPRLVLVTNPKSEKSIIAAALESGPAPWVGVDSSSNSSPKQGWKDPQIGTPEEYEGIVSGLPPKAYNALGLNPDDGGYPSENKVSLTYKWAEDQSILPGPADHIEGVDVNNCEDEQTAQPTNGEFVFYSQNDPKWGNLTYNGGGDIASSGCGLTSYTMIAATIKGDKSINPKVMRNWIEKDGANISGYRGLAMAAYGKKRLGIDYEQVYTKEKVKEALARGDYVISGGGGANTPYRFGAHIIAVHGIDEKENIIVADPEDNEPQERKYSLDSLMNNGKYWVVVKK